MPNMIMIFRIPERILFNVSNGDLSAFMPQYIVKGNEIIPVQVMRVPRGINLFLSSEIVSKEEPVTKSITTLKVKVR